MKPIRRTLLLLLALLLLFHLWEGYRNYRQPVVSSLPAEKMITPENEVLWKLNNGQAVKLEEIRSVCRYINSRYDCADFRLQSLLRILYEHKDKLTPEMQTEIKLAFTNFKYWMNEPGQDGMCYWSENHQLLFAAAEYLAGQYYSQTIFSNADLSDSDHMVRARKRILTWLDLRWRYGFSEYYSNVYYVEDIAPLCNLIDFCNDEEIVTKSRMILDLLIYDLASQSWAGQFATTSGRAYEQGKKAGAKAAASRITRVLFAEPSGSVSCSGMDVNFFSLKNYAVPQVLREIGKDCTTRIIKASSGLDLNELAAEGLIGPDDPQIMMQWGMEAFTNPQVVANSVAYIDRNGLYANQFLHDFRWLNFKSLKLLDLYPILSRAFDPQSNGTAIQRANTYLYRTPCYSMYTTQAYHPGEFGNQEHLFGVTLAPDLAVFHNHPVITPDAAVLDATSLNYWVGNGRLPHSVQEENINLSIYILPERPNLLERKIIPYTHLYLPAARFDRVLQEGERLYARHGRAYLAFFTNKALRYNGINEEWIQEGRETYWICVMGSAEEEPFEAFCQRMRQAIVTYRQKKLTFNLQGKGLCLTYAGDFTVDGQVRDLHYPRYESDYLRARRKPEELKIVYNNHSLYLNFDKMVRIER